MLRSFIVKVFIFVSSCFILKQLGKKKGDTMTQNAHAPRAGVDPTLYRLLGMLRGMIIARAVHVVAKHRIADLLSEGPKNVSQLAETLQVHAQTLHHLLSALASTGVFQEVEPGYFQNTDLSTFLRSDVPHSLLNAALYWGSDWQWRLWESLDYTVKTGEPAFNHLFDTSLWEFLDQHPEEERVFSAALTSFSSSLIPLIVQSYDFSSIGTIVDVGGGEGDLLTGILHTYPNMKGTLLERPSVLRIVRERLKKSGLTDRCTLMEGNFFQHVPAGMDAYIMREVLHDWNDEHCIEILQCCRRAMSASSRLLVVEHIFYPEDQRSFTKFLGLQMALEQEGRQRTKEELYELLAAAGFEVRRFIPIPEPTTTILECFPIIP